MGAEWDAIKNEQKLVCSGGKQRINPTGADPATQIRSGCFLFVCQFGDMGGKRKGKEKRKKRKEKEMELSLVPCHLPTG